MKLQVFALVAYVFTFIVAPLVVLIYLVRHS